MRLLVKFSTKIRLSCRFIMNGNDRPAVASVDKLRDYKSAKEFRLATPEFQQILTPEVHNLESIFTKHGYEIRIAGGAVRDLLSGKQPKDLDFATTATPIEMKEMLEKENIRMINAAGEKHGTITARINNDNFEVTTLRVDKVTNGRHAEVEFIKNWELDANRRDFTINSMFLDLGGIVYDFCDGFNDLKDQRVRFVGKPEVRIQEDYLRIMRYFRFVGRISKDPLEHEEATIDAIKANKEPLAKISGERIWGELKKIVEGNFGTHLLIFMLDIGLGPQMGFPTDCDMEQLSKVKNNESLEAITIICTALRTSEDLLKLRQRLKISNFDRDCGLFFIQQRDVELPEDPLRYFRKLVITTTGNTQDIRQWVEQVILYRGLTDVLDKFRKWQMPIFPIKGDVIPKVCEIKNPSDIGRLIALAKCYWAERDFQPTKEELIEELPKLYANLQNKKRHKAN